MLDNKDIIKELQDYTLVKTSYLTNLIEDSDFLNCLREAGVDNWGGYEIAQEMYSSEE